MLNFQIFKMSIAESSRNLMGLLQIAILFDKKSCLISFWSQSRRPTTVYHNIPRKFLSKRPFEENLSKANQEALHKCRGEMLMQKLMLAWSIVIFEELFKLLSMSFLPFVAQVWALNGKQ
jgi:hypothetical protein